MSPQGCCSGGTGGSADLEIYQGDDWLSTVTVLDGSKPADITGFTAQAQIRRDVADVDPNVVVEITTVVNSPYILLSIDHLRTATMSGTYVWDLQIVTLEGAIETLLTGSVYVTQEVTRNNVVLAKSNGQLATK